MKKFYINILAILLITSLQQNVVFARDSVTLNPNITYETHYRLDTGNVHMWANSSGVWIKDGNGIIAKPHSWYNNPSDVRVKLEDGAVVTNVYPYDKDNFLFEEDLTYYHWNMGGYGIDKLSYNEWYYSRGSSDIDVESFTTEVIESGESSGTYASFNWKAKLTPKQLVLNPTDDVDVISEEYFYYDVKESIKKKYTISIL